MRSENTNFWLDRMGHRNLLVRLDGEAVRAVLSTRYVPVSNVDLVRRLASSLGDPAKALEDLPRRHGLTEAEHEAVKAAWAGEQGPTLYNLVNSLTGAAKSDALPVESRLHLQALAWDGVWSGVDAPDQTPSRAAFRGSGSCPASRPGKEEGERFPLRPRLREGKKGCPGALPRRCLGRPQGVECDAWRGPRRRS